jgi:hypothetical protein
MSYSYVYTVSDVSKCLSLTHIYGTNKVTGINGIIELTANVEYVETLSGTTLILHRKVPMMLGGSLNFEKIVVPNTAVNSYKQRWPQYASIIISNEEYELSLKFYTKEEANKTFIKTSSLKANFFQNLYNE